MTFLLQAAPPDPGRLSQQMMYLAAIFIAILLVGWIVIAIAKKRSEEAVQQAKSSAIMPFTLDDLRQMHDNGELTDEQFERAKGKILAMTKASLRPPTPAKEIEPKTELPPEGDSTPPNR